MTKEVMQQALEALENHEGNYKLGRAGCERQEAAITAIKEALAQPPLPVQEPVAWDKPSDNFNDWWDSDRHDNANPFEKDSAAYWAWEGWQAALAQRPWVGLTEFQFAEIYNKWNDSNGSTPWGLNQALEAKLKELNK